MTEPAYRTESTGAQHFGADIAAMAGNLGFAFMPHQQLAAELFTEHDGDGVPVHGTAAFLIPRQNGKSYFAQVMLAWAALRERSYSIYTAQTRAAATSRLRDLGQLLTVAGIEVKVTLGVGNERAVFPNGSIIEVMSPNAEAVHGESISGLAVLDEAHAVSPVVLQGILPAMSAKPRSLLLVISTAGTQESELLNTYIELGRAADPTMSYLEYSAPDDADVYDAERWGEWMPALDIQTDRRKISEAAAVLSFGDFRRAYGNLTTVGEDSELVEHERWEAARNDLAVPSSGLVIAVDVSQSPGGAAIAVAQREAEGYHLELVEHRTGSTTTWVLPRVAELAERYQAEGIGIATASPSGHLDPELQSLCEQAGIPLRRMTQKDRSAADTFLVDGLRDGTVSHNQSEPLDAAVRGAQIKATTEDGWLVDRKRSYVDVSPWIAASIATFLCHEVYVLRPTPAIL